MKKSTWRSRIKKACKAAGTYQPFFDQMIDTLAGILEMRDNAREKFEEAGGDPVIEHTNKNGNTNLVRNPALTVIMECNTQALAFWRDLGLTPAGLKRVNDEGLKAKPKEDNKTMLDRIREKHGK